jgi:hypothetical protein
MTRDQAELERLLWEERRAIQVKQEDRVKTAQTKYASSGFVLCEV